MASLLRGDFERIPLPRGDVKQVEESLLVLTTEQYKALDAVQENDRVVLKGLAGTGKTFLAREAARRAVADGNRVLLLCYNRLLGDWMQAATSGLTDANSSLFHCKHLHGLLMEVAGNPTVPPEDNDFWAKKLPQAALDHLLESGQAAGQYDVLLVDEAQDILSEDYLDVLDLLLKGGLAGGRWSLFGDFDRQAIYLRGGSHTAAKMLDSLCKRAPNHATFRLRINCRNAAPIAETLTLACNVNPGYSDVLQQMEGASVVPRFWETEDEQSRMLENTVTELRTAFHADEIVVLSINSDDRSCAQRSLGEKNARYTPFRDSGSHPVRNIRYASIHAFKGLDAGAIVITDIRGLDEYTRALLYIGMSRARVRLVMMMKKNCRNDYRQMLRAGLTNNQRKQVDAIG